MMQYVVCYKTKEPVIYNKGTQWETTCDTFPSFYMGRFSPLEEAIKMCKELNENKPLKLWNGKDIDWNKIDFFYVDEQEPMCD